MDHAQARFIFQHLFLPPDLPQTDHEELGAESLLKQVETVAHAFSSALGTDAIRGGWRSLARSAKKWVQLYADGMPSSYIIMQALNDMQDHGKYLPSKVKVSQVLIIIDVLMFYVKSQNATVIARHLGTGIVFECFEVVPEMRAVIKAKNALVRSFPARAIFVPKEIMEADTFLEELSLALHRLSTEQLKQSKEVAIKAGNVVAESRESPAPKFVTEWLFGAVLSAYGKVTSSQSISKRTHDDVVTKGLGIPWRRSAVWLSLRVTFQLALLNSDLDDSDSTHYKNFMLFFLASVSTQIIHKDTSPATLHVIRVKLARRNAKLGQRTFSFVQDYVSKTLAEINTAMKTQ
ncbi:hypothetical protein LTR84_012335 [Exophiala bonariae]|uniref:DUF6606 domain-containing protein n=1 Tax=Exophiala bonariae TaxID=1690606 RepID=A0AAV9NGB6_9EURO|nr:hypothetical protein LTR84_012335 [Exophiala bonariae]